MCIHNPSAVLARPTINHSVCMSIEALFRRVENVKDYLCSSRTDTQMILLSQARGPQGDRKGSQRTMLQACMSLLVAAICVFSFTAGKWHAPLFSVLTRGLCSHLRRQFSKSFAQDCGTSISTTTGVVTGGNISTFQCAWYHSATSHSQDQESDCHSRVRGVINMQFGHACSQDHLTHAKDLCYATVLNYRAVCMYHMPVWALVVCMHGTSTTDVYSPGINSL